MRKEIAKIGKRGIFVIPAELRKKMHLQEGDFLIIESEGNAIILRPAVTLPVEIYTNERKAEFLLSNALNPSDYEEACKEVRKMGLDPDKIAHYKPE